jgi:hypothetical protein
MESGELGLADVAGARFLQLAGRGLRRLAQEGGGHEHRGLARLSDPGHRPGLAILGFLAQTSDAAQCLDQPLFLKRLRTRDLPCGDEQGLALLQGHCGEQPAIDRDPLEEFSCPADVVKIQRGEGVDWRFEDGGVGRTAGHQPRILSVVAARRGTAVAASLRRRLPSAAPPVSSVHLDHEPNRKTDREKQRPVSNVSPKKARQGSVHDDRPPRLNGEPNDVEKSLKEGNHCLKH